MSDLTTILSTSTETAAPTATVDPATQASTPDWLSSVPEAYRNDDYVKSHANAESLFAEYSTLKKTAGQSNIPNWDAPYDQNKDFFQKVGVPESPDKYEVQPPETYKGEMNQDFVNKMREVAHKYKIPAGAFKEFAAEYMNYEQVARDSQGALAQEELASRSKVLQEKWGAEAEARTEFAKQAYGKFATPELIQELEQSNIHTHPAFLQFVSEVGKAMQPPTSPGASSTSGSSVSGNLVSNADQAKEAIKAIHADPQVSKALYNPKDPNHKALNAKLDSLYQQAYSNV